MSGRLYVGNLPYAVDEAALVTFFDGFSISNIKLVADHVTGKAKGFGFVDLEGEVQAAIDALDGQQLGGRTVKVSVAKEKPRTHSNDGASKRRGDGTIWND